MAKKDAKRAPKEDTVNTSLSTNGSAAKDPIAPGESGGFSAGAFAEGTREELTKVIWPTRQQLISESAAVIFDGGALSHHHLPGRQAVWLGI